MRLIRHIVAIATVATVILTAPSPATAAGPARDPSAQARIDRHLAAHPGGKQINASQISYGAGTVVVTFGATSATLAASPNCPSGWFCLYDYSDYGGDRAYVGSCGFVDLYAAGWSDRAGSVYNSTSNSVTVLNHGAKSDHSADGTLFWVSPRRGMITLSPYSNTVDHVFRYC